MFDRLELVRSGIKGIPAAMKRRFSYRVALFVLVAVATWGTVAGCERTTEPAQPAGTVEIQEVSLEPTPAPPTMTPTVAAPATPTPAATSTPTPVIETPTPVRDGYAHACVADACGHVHARRDSAGIAHAYGSGFDGDAPRRAGNGRFPARGSLRLGQTRSWRRNTP